jgi:hypothetical protein
VGGDGLLDLDAGDVLAPGDDDVKFSSLIRANSVGDGGAAATMAVTFRSRRCARGWLMIISCTVGAPL